MAWSSRRPDRPTREQQALLDVNFREVVHSARTGNPDVAKPQRFAEDRMDTHKNARLTPKGREEMVRAVADRGMSKAAAAHQFNTTPKTVGKWVDRFCAEGVDGLRDRSSRPLSSPNQIPLASAGSLASNCRSHIHATSARNQARSSISTLRSSAVSAAWATASPDAAQAIAAVKVQAGNSSTSLSTTILG